MQNVEIIYSRDTGTLAVGFRNPTVEESKQSRRHDLGPGVKLWASPDGEVVYTIEIDGGAAERVDLDSIKLTTCDSDGSSQQTVYLPERSPE